MLATNLTSLVSFLGSVSYYGTTLAAPPAGILLTKYSQKAVLQIFLGVNVVFCILVAFSFHPVQLFIARTMVGVRKVALSNGGDKVDMS